MARADVTVEVEPSPRLKRLLKEAGRCNDLRARLEALIESWRREARARAAKSVYPEHNGAWAGATNVCANQLEAALKEQPREVE